MEQRRIVQTASAGQASVQRVSASAQTHLNVPQVRAPIWNVGQPGVQRATIDAHAPVNTAQRILSAPPTSTVPPTVQRMPVGFPARSGMIVAPMSPTIARLIAPSTPRSPGQHLPRVGDGTSLLLLRMAQPAAQDATPAPHTLASGQMSSRNASAQATPHRQSVVQREAQSDGSRRIVTPSRSAILPSVPMQPSRLTATNQPGAKVTRSALTGSAQPDLLPLIMRWVTREAAMESAPSVRGTPSPGRQSDATVQRTPAPSRPQDTPPGRQPTTVTRPIDAPRQPDRQPTANQSSAPAMLRRTPDARGAQPTSGSKPLARDTATAVGQPSNARQPAVAPQRAYYPALMRSVSPTPGAANSTTGLPSDATPNATPGAVRPNVTIASMAAPLASASIARSVAPSSMATAEEWNTLSLLQRLVMPRALPTEREQGRAFDAPASAAPGRQSDATVQRDSTLAQSARASDVPSVQRVANVPSAPNAIASFVQRARGRSPLGGAVQRVANMSPLLERMTAPPAMAYPTMTPTPLLHQRAARAVAPDAGSSVQHATAAVQRFAPGEPNTVRPSAPHRSTPAAPWSLQRTPAALGSTLIERMVSPLPIANLLLQRQASPHVARDAGRAGTQGSDTGAAGRTSAGTSAAYPQPLALLRTRPVASLARDTQPPMLSRTRSVEQPTPAQGAAWPRSCRLWQPHHPVRRGHRRGTSSAVRQRRQVPR